MLSFDDKPYMGIRPFSSNVFHDPIISARALEQFRGLSLLNDDSYLSYLLYVDQNIEFALRNSTYKSKHIQDLLIELQGLVYKAEGNKISEELIALTKQVLFKCSADYLIASTSEMKDLVCILSSLSYHAVDCVVFENMELAAYSAVLALDSLSLFLHTYDETYDNAWSDSELGCRIVNAIIPNDERICRLHSTLYQNARDFSDSLLPILEDELPEIFADRILPFLEHDRVLRILVTMMRRLPITESDYAFNLFQFFNHFVRKLKTTPSEDEFTKFDSSFFTSADFALLLEWLKQWSETSQNNTKIASKISFTKEQLIHWESVVAHIREQRISPECRLRVSTVIRTVRLDKPYRNVKILYAIFKFIRENAFPSIWRHGYASLIIKNLQDIEYMEPSKTHLFYIRTIDTTITVNEEELIYRDLENSLKPQTDYVPCTVNIEHQETHNISENGQDDNEETKAYVDNPHGATEAPEFSEAEPQSVEPDAIAKPISDDEEASKPFSITDISIDEESYILNAIQQTLNSTMQLYKDVGGNIGMSLDNRLDPDIEDSYKIRPSVNGAPHGHSLLSFLDQQLKLDTAEDAEKISALIENCSNMKALELKGNTLGIEAGKRISASLTRHPELQRCLWSDLFTGRLKNEIPPVLQCLTNALITANCHITELDLSDNAFGPIGAEGIQDFLISPAAYTLEVLKLNNNGLGSGGRIIAECLVQCHTNAMRDGMRFKLKTFIAGRNRLENPGAVALAKAFTVIGTIENLQIPQNGICLEGILALAESFEYNRNLKTIVLNDNTCGADGAYLIAKSLTNLINLEVLDLGDCLCRSDGCGAVIAVLCDGRHHQIKLVDLSGSELSGIKGKNILRMWRAHFGRSDSKLVLSHNMFGGLFKELQLFVESSLPNVSLGCISDDEGSASEKYSSSDSSDSEDIAKSDDQYDNDIQLHQLHITDEIYDECLLSFLDQQLKLDTAEDAEKISALIENCSNMKALELKGNTLGIEAGKRISASLTRHPELQRCLWSDLFTGRLKNEIPPVLQCLTNALITANCHITELDLSDNAFGPIGAEGIQDFLISPAAYTLEVLKLNNNGLGSGGRIIAECLVQCHTNAMRDGMRFKLKTFIAGRNRLENPGAVALAKAFTVIGTIENLQIPQNGICLEGILALAESFEYNRNLKTIVLNDNTCGADGAYLIAKSLTNLINLEVLDLGDCLCRSDGCGAVIAVLCDGRHHQVKMVDLSGSELPGKRARLIVKSWMQSFTGTEAFLKLTNNMFGSMFYELEKRIKAGNLRIDIGDIDDDEGSADDNEESDEDDDSA